jgi:prepilin-type N-terminal cleavage/methylation domain-containing protein
MRSQPQRPAFTLIEILVVISIIAVLAALALGVSMNVIQSQHQANSETAIRTLMQTVEQHWNDVVAQAGKEKPSMAAMMLADNDLKRAKAIHTKFRLMEAFPATFREVQQPCYVNNASGAAVQTTLPLVYVPPTYLQGGVLTPNKDWPGGNPIFPNGWALVSGGQPMLDKNNRRYMSTFTKKVTSTSSGTPNADEASALLFISLSMKKDGAHPLDADTLGKSYVKDRAVQGGQYPCLVDSWGNSLWFFRFPTGNADSLDSLAAKTQTSATGHDRLDPNKRLQDLNWFNKPTPPPPNNVTTYGAIYEALVHPLPRNANGVIVNRYMIPVLVSAGRNGQFGLNGDFSVSTNAQQTDNLYSFRLLLGAGTE